MSAIPSSRVALTLTICLLIAVVECFQLSSWQTISRHTRGMTMNCKSLTQVCLEVPDAKKASEFYQSALNMANEAEETMKMNLKSDSSKFTINFKSNSALNPDKLGDFMGLGVKLANPLDAMDVSMISGGSVVKEIIDGAYGASLIPDEDEMKQFPVRYGTIADPNGVQIEIIDGTDANTHPEAKLRLSVLDLDESIDFYSKYMGMKFLRKRSNVNSVPRHGSFVAYMGYGTDDDGVILELTYKYAVDKIKVGEYLKALVFTATDPAMVKEALRGDKKQVEEEGTNGSFLTYDPTGYPVRVVPE